VVLAGVCLFGLGPLAQQIDQQGQPVSRPPTVTAPQPRPAGPFPTATTPSAGLGGSPAARGDTTTVTKQVVVVPNSTCHRYVEALGQSRALTISVQNSCQ
jgi:hypothetical protein